MVNSGSPILAEPWLLRSYLDQSFDSCIDARRECDQSREHGHKIESAGR